jgi:hypothetical protein
MNKAQATALQEAIEGQEVACSANVTFVGGVEDWTVTIPPSQALNALQLGELADYVQSVGLTLSATFSYLGVD